MNLQILVEQIPAQGLRLALREPAERFPALVQLAADGGIRLLGPLMATVDITPEKSMFHVTGRVTGEVEIPCSRCLSPFRHGMDEPFELTYTERVPGDQEAELELTAADMGMERLKNDRIDLAEALQEQVIVALPMRPLCRRDCKGLCPGCGADLNTEPCTCAGQSGDPRFAILEKLKTGRRDPDSDL